jgi:hypothetical protein
LHNFSHPPPETIDKDSPILATEITEQERCELAREVSAILKEWQLDPELQLHLLGMPEDSPQRELTKFRNGKALPQDEELLDRARHIIGIHNSLHVVFPLNNNMPGFWVRTRNRFLRGIPLAIMYDEGVSGMHRVWRHLDCTLNWD